MDKIWNANEAKQAVGVACAQSSRIERSNAVRQSGSHAPDFVRAHAITVAPQRCKFQAARTPKLLGPRPTNSEVITHEK